jgi:antitoxin (DNA-binding transcriptional repressor) of toxin-antitoxin stability system
MSKQVTVEELIANIAEHVADVKKGETLTIVEDGTQIATLTPQTEKRAKYPFRDLKFGPRPEGLKTDPAQIIREDRDAERKKHGF